MTETTAGVQTPVPTANPMPKAAPKAKPKATSPKAKKIKVSSKATKTPAVPKTNKTPRTAVVALKDIVLSTEWNREKLGDIKGLVQSIKEVGLEVPLIVRPHKNNKYMLIDGRRRYAALQEAGIKEVLVVCKEEDDKQAFSTSVVANSGREDNTPWEKSCSYQKMLDNGLSVKQIAQYAACSEGFVSQHLAAQKVHKNLQDALKTGKIPLSAIRHFVRLDPENHKADATMYDKMMEALISGKYSAQDVGERIDLHLSKKAKATGAKTKKNKAAGKKRPGPKIQVTDYTQPEVKKLIKMIPKNQALDWLTHLSEKLQASTSTKKRLQYQYTIEGLEIACGLIIEE